MPTNRRAPVRPLVASLVATPLVLVAGATPAPTTPATPATPTAAPEADLEVIYGITSIGHIHPGETYDFRVGVRNHGSAPARTVQLVIDVPTVITVEAPPAPCSFATPLLTCAFSRLAPGEVVDLAGVASLDPAYVGDGSDIVRTVTVSSATPDPDAANNTVTVAGPAVEGARSVVAACPPPASATSTDRA